MHLYVVSQPPPAKQVSQYFPTVHGMCSASASEMATASKKNILVNVRVIQVVTPRDFVDEFRPASAPRELQ
jgi:hypothetical protein